MRKQWLRHFIIISLLAAPVFPAAAEDERTYRDVQTGAEIRFPKNRPVFTAARPGPYTALAAQHLPAIKTRTRKIGLETSRALRFRVPASKQDPIRAIYVLDKDNIIIGYVHFEPEQADGQIWLSGNINYVKIYAECADHGLWLTELRLDLV